MTNQNGSLDHGYELPLETGTGDKNCEITFDMSKLTFDFAVSRPSLRAPKIGNQSFSSEITLFQLAVGTAAFADIQPHPQIGGYSGNELAVKIAG